MQFRDKLELCWVELERGSNVELNTAADILCKIKHDKESSLDDLSSAIFNAELKIMNSPLSGRSDGKMQLSYQYQSNPVVTDAFHPDYKTATFTPWAATYNGTLKQKS